jgi:hypothetical protein
VELEDMVAAGMPPGDVIVAATGNSARFMGLDDTGVLEAGRSADFIVLDANPLEDITNTRRIADVVLRGEVLVRVGCSAGWAAARNCGGAGPGRSGAPVRGSPGTTAAKREAVMNRWIWLVVTLALAGSAFAGRIVFHLWTDHGTLDAFHLVVSLATGAAGLMLAGRLLRRAGGPAGGDGGQGAA